MPAASGAAVKYAYKDHDAGVVDEQPPNQNQWYTAFHAYDVRLIWCQIDQTNEETNAKDIELIWNIDGTPYFYGTSLADSTFEWINRNTHLSAGGTDGLDGNQTAQNAGYYVDKRGHDFEVKIRMTSLPGTTQTLRCRCVYETLEVT